MRCLTKSMSQKLNDKTTKDIDIQRHILSSKTRKESCLPMFQERIFVGHKPVPNSNGETYKKSYPSRK